MTVWCFLRLLLLIGLFALALCSCSKNNSTVDGGDTDTGLDTDTTYDGGPTTACEGDPPEGGMVCVPGGRYLMGCMPYDTQCEDSEKPMVEVTLSPFWIDKAEVTIEKLLPFLNTLHEGYIRVDGYVGIDPDYETIYQNSASGRAPVCLNTETDEFEYSWTCAGENTCNRPIYAATGGLSWLGAKMLCEWRGMRLPTEAEWEAAARGQTKLIYPCAYEHLSCWYGRYDACYFPDGNGPSASDVECPTEEPPCCIPFPEGQDGTCNSPIGVTQMYGNAAEWVLDRKDADHSWCANGCTDPAPRQGEAPFMKGGGIRTDATMTRISARYQRDVQGPASYSGVRCVSSPVQHVLPDGGVVWGE